MEALSITLLDFVLFLLAPMLLVPAARWLGIGEIPGYLIAGVIIGPWGLSLIRDAAIIDTLFWITAGGMFFLAGFKLQYSTFRSWRILIYPGLLQASIFMVAVSILTLIFSRPYYEGIITGYILALSYPATPDSVDHLHSDKPGVSLNTSVRYSHILIAVAVLLAIPLTGPGNPLLTDPDVYYVVGSVLLAIAILAGAGFLLDQAGRWLIRERLASLCSVVFVATAGIVLLLADVLSLSYLYGLFLTGVLLANIEQRKAARQLIFPIVQMGTGLFFVAVAMKIDFGMVLQWPSETLGLFLALVVIKFVLWYLVLMRSTATMGTRLRFGVEQVQANGVAFILILLATQHHVISAKLGALLYAVLAFTLLGTPFLSRLLNSVMSGSSGQFRQPASSHSTGNQQGPVQVVVAGFGRVGQVVGRMLRAANVPFAVVDLDESVLEPARQSGYSAYNGDATRLEVLRQAGLDQGTVLVVALHDENDCAKLIETVRSSYSEIPIVARARHRQQCSQYQRHQVRHIQREFFESAVLMGEDVLQLKGFDFDEVERQSEAFRDHDSRLLQQEYDEWERQGFPVSETGLQSLQQIFDADSRQQALEQRITRREKID